VNHDSGDPVDLCERLQRIRRDLRNLGDQYQALDIAELDVDELGEPAHPNGALMAVTGALIVARNSLETAIENACRLRGR